MYSAEIKISDIDNDRIPTPKGYKVLIAVPQVEEKTTGGIIRPDQLRKLEETASIFGFVVELGDLAYRDEDKFPTGPFCKPGDWIVFRSYSGTRFKIGNHEFRLINDDTVEAVVDDPRGIERAA
jgi:co-chaperonin GroES (HSP10)